MTAFNDKRVYEPPAADDGTRVLVDRLWPRGIARDKARIDLWLKDIAPSDALRKRFHGKTENWEAFRIAYFAELEGAAEQAAARTGTRARAQWSRHLAVRGARPTTQQCRRVERVAAAAP